MATADVRPIRSRDLVPAASGPADATAVTAAPMAFGAGAHVAAHSPRRSDSATPVAAGSPRRTDAQPTREVLNAARALREMPPFAREREIDSGRYSHFSAEERAELRILVR